MMQMQQPPVVNEQADTTEALDHALRRVVVVNDLMPWRKMF